MKFLGILSSLLLALASNSLFVLGAPEQTSSFELFENFREPKNIMFSCMYGGSSHITWVLSILEELSARGHSTFYLTRDDQIKFAKDYPFIQVKSIGPGIEQKEREESIKDLRSKPIVQGLKKLLVTMTDNFEEEYIGNRDFINSNDIGIAICDHFGTPCVEAAVAANIPFIVTSSFSQGKDASAPYINNEMITMQNPTTEFMSLKDRINDMFIKPFQLMIVLRKNMQRLKQVYKSLGIQPSMHAHQKWAGAIKLVNSAWGFEHGRPVGPLVELVGPILPRRYPGLTPSMQEFLNLHQRVAFIAFGQHAIADEADGRMIMTALLEALEAKEIGGIIWATRGVEGMFPTFVTTTHSNTTYAIQSFFDETQALQSHVFFLNWAPQMAILSHPSTNLFVTHGGAGSLYESLYAGVKIVVFPFFGDQPAAATTAEKNGIGLHLNINKSQQEANEVVSRVARDEGGVIQANVNRFKALVQIKAASGVKKSADIVEEVLFLQKESQIPHRWDVKRNMSFIKANNYDIYAFLLTLVACLGYGAWNILAYVVSSSPTNNKLKSL